MRGINWPVDSGSPKTTRNNFVTSTSLYNFYGATMTIQGSFILKHLHVIAIFGRKKQRPVKIGSTNDGFSEI